jgi:hypothetical protein
MLILRKTNHQFRRQAYLQRKHQLALEPKRNRLFLWIPGPQILQQLLEEDHPALLLLEVCGGLMIVASSA